MRLVNFCYIIFDQSGDFLELIVVTCLPFPVKGSAVKISPVFLSILNKPEVWKKRYLMELKFRITNLLSPTPISAMVTSRIKGN